jgi:hypothetical protein
MEEVMKKKDLERARVLIIHDYAEGIDECLPGEEVIAIILVWRGRWYWIPWGPTHLIVGDFLARHRWMGLDAWQISAKMQQDSFVQQHGTNAPGNKGRPARTSPTGARQQMKRMRDVLADLIADKQLDLTVDQIIRTERTSTGTARYRIVADVSWRHLPHAEGEDELFDPRILGIHLGLPGSTGATGNSGLNSTAL